MPLEKFTLDEYAIMMREGKPYLMAIEELVKETNYGEVEMTLQVRSGVVERMDVTKKKTWLKPKPGHPLSEFTTVVEKVTIQQ
jgi:hypothetical protein